VIYNLKTLLQIMMSLAQLQKELLAEEAASSVSNMTDGVNAKTNNHEFIDYYHGN